MPSTAESSGVPAAGACPFGHKAAHHADPAPATGNEDAVRDARGLPLPPGPGAIAALLGLSREVLRFFHSCFRIHGDVVRLPFLGRHIILVSHPDDVAYVMKQNVANYSKGGFGYKELKVVLGNGLGPSKGEMWKRQRKMAQPAFAPTPINGYVPDVVSTALEWVDRKKRAAEPVLDIGEAMLELNLRVSCNTLVRAELTDQVLHEVSEHFVAVVQDMEHRVGQAVNIPLAIPTPQNRRVKQSIAAINDFVDGIIAQRHTAGEGQDDLLTVLMRGSGHPDDAKIPHLLRDHVKNFFFGGHETSGYTLTWLFYLLARHPEVDRLVGQELAEVLGGRAPTADVTPRLIYTSQVIQETLRLYPIFPMLPRRCVEQDVLRGYRIPAGANIMICPYLTNRHPAFWDEPDIFNPDRFKPGIKRHPFAMIPFGGGPSVCIGRNFGMMTTLMIFASLRQHFRFELAEDKEIDILMPGFSLQPEQPVRMRMMPVAANAVHPAPPASVLPAATCPFSARSVAA
jgi:cytochrome P450